MFLKFIIEFFSIPKPVLGRWGGTIHKKEIGYCCNFEFRYQDHHIIHKIKFLKVKLYL